MANSYLFQVLKVVNNVPKTKYDDKSGNSDYWLRQWHKLVVS